MSLNDELFAAIEELDIAKVSDLINEGADPDARDNNGSTALHSASRSNNFEIVKFLIDKGADVNVAQNSGRTPLHLAAGHSSNLEIVRNLIERGASVSAKDNKGRTPLDIAKTECSNCKDIINLLEEKNANRDASTAGSISSTTPSHRTQAGHVLRDVLHATDELFDAILLGNYSKVKSAIEEGANVNAKDYGGFTPLHQATDFSNLEIVQYLLEKGADVNAKDNDEDTILHKAVSSSSSNLEIVKYLVEKGAGINTKGYEGHTPLHRAILSASNNLDIVKYLIEKDADVNAKDSKGRTPLDLAQVDLVLNQGIIDYLKAKSTSSNIQNTTESINSTTSSQAKIRHKRQMERHVLRHHSIKNDIDYNHVRLGRLVATFLPALADNAVHKEIPQLTYVQSNTPSYNFLQNGTVPLNDTLLLFDVFARKVTGQKPVSTTATPGLSQEQRMLDYTLNINNDFEKAVKYAAKKSGVPVRLSSVKFLVYDEICAKIASGKSYEIPAVLSSYAEKACVNRQVSAEKCDEFMKAFNEKLNIEARPNSHLEDVSISSSNITRGL